MKTKAILLAALFLSGAAQAQDDGKDRWVAIINDTNDTMTQFYASRTTRDKWGHDRLGTKTIWAGYQRRVNIVDGTNACWYDFKAVFENGTETKSTKPINVCTTTSWRVWN